MLGLKCFLWTLKWLLFHRHPSLLPFWSHLFSLEPQFCPSYLFFAHPPAYQHYFFFFLNFSPDRLSGHVGKAVCAGLPSTVIGAAAHLTVTVICSPLSETPYPGTGPSRSCPCSTALLYGMTDGSEGAGQLIFASRPGNLEQSVRQQG